MGRWGDGPDAIQGVTSSLAARSGENYGLVAASKERVLLLSLDETAKKIARRRDFLRSVTTGGIKDRVSKMIEVCRHGLPLQLTLSR